MAIGFAVVAIGVLFAVQLAQPDPITAEVIRPIAAGSDDSPRPYLVRWTDSEGTQEGVVFIPERYAEASTAPILIHTSTLEPYVTDGTWPLAAYSTAATLGLLLGLVVSFSVDGFGYVRGTGQVSETPDLDVAEDRGFYWRT